MAFETPCKNNSEKNRNRYHVIYNKTKKVMARAMRIEANKEIAAFSKRPNKLFKFLKIMKRRKNIKDKKCKLTTKATPLSPQLWVNSKKNINK